MNDTPRNEKGVQSLRRLAGLAPLLLAGLVMACDQVGPSLGAGPTQTDEETAQYVIVADQSSWVQVPDGVLTLERAVGPDREQRVALRNESTLPGDNWLLLRARTRGGVNAPLRSNEFVTRTGGIPTPFTSLREGNLNSATDALGSYHWAEERVGADTVCILALRRIGEAERIMPSGANVMDVMMRNCVVGTREEALAPITAERLAYFPRSAGGAAPSENRNLSPLAAPMR